MPKNTRPIPNWQRERAQRTGTARQRRAALAMFKPIRGMSPGSLPPGEPASNRAAAQHKPPDTLNMANKLEELKNSTAVVEPQGQRMTLNLSPAFLMEDPTMEMRNSIGSRELPSTIAGDMWGAITHGYQHPNEKSPGKMSIRWCGEIGFRTRTGKLGEADNAYLPLTVERKLINAGAPVIGEDQILPNHAVGWVAEFSVQFVCEKYVPPPGKTGPGFTYACYNRMGRRRDINRLAPPEVQAMLPARTELAMLGYDPETGEVTEEAGKDAAE